jgi:hypothetical protein
MPACSTCNLRALVLGSRVSAPPRVCHELGEGQCWHSHRFHTQVHYRSHSFKLTCGYSRRHFVSDMLVHFLAPLRHREAMLLRIVPCHSMGSVQGLGCPHRFLAEGWAEEGQSFRLWGRVGETERMYTLCRVRHVATFCNCSTERA